MVAVAMTHDDLKEWIDWEGGYGSLIQHGVIIEDLPEDVQELWRSAEEAFAVFSGITGQISEIIGY